MYKKIVTDYKKNFSTLAFIKNHIPLYWRIMSLLVALLAIFCGIRGAWINNYYYLIPYSLLLGILMLGFHLKTRKLQHHLLRREDSVQFIKLLVSYNIIVPKNPTISKERTYYLTTIANRELNRRKISSRFVGVMLLIISPAIKFGLTELSSIKGFSSSNDLLVLFFSIALMIAGIIIMMVPILQLLLDRGYSKEIEFRNRLEQLLLFSNFHFRL